MTEYILLWLTGMRRSRKRERMTAGERRENEREVKIKGKIETNTQKKDKKKYQDNVER
jgi:hypothetical protein